MGRPLRLDPYHGVHHVYCRGTRRWLMFIDDLDRLRFERRLATVCDRYGAQVLAYCLMSNHFHIVLYCPDSQLSNALRDLKSLYARMYNDRHGFSGPVFEGRFRSKLVRDHAQLVTLIRYVHRNPFSIDPGMRLADYPWSSHPIYLGEQSQPSWVNITLAMPLFGDTRAEYRAIVETARQTDKVQNRTLASNQPRRAPAFRQRASPAHILETVARVSGRPLADVRPRMRNGLVGLAALAALEYAEYSSAELAEPYGFASSHGLRRAVQNARARIALDPDFAMIHENVRIRLTGG